MGQKHTIELAPYHKYETLPFEISHLGKMLYNGIKTRVLFIASTHEECVSIVKMNDLNRLLIGRQSFVISKKYEEIIIIYTTRTEYTDIPIYLACNKKEKQKFLQANPEFLLFWQILILNLKNYYLTIDPDDPYGRAFFIEFQYKSYRK